MNRSFHELARPVDPAIVAVLRSVHDIASALNQEYVLVGAAARDLVLVNALGLSSSRATRDIDFGLAVESWEQFAEFKEGLVAGGHFRANTRAVQRLHDTPSEGGWELPVDIIPFGALASADGKIAWPPSGDVVMNVAGFDEALRSTVGITIAKELAVRVASIPGLAILKLHAWHDRGRENNKDASDLFTILSTYADAGNFERLYGEELDLLLKEEFDSTLAGAQMLGRDVARVCGQVSLQRVLRILELGAERLADQMNRAHDPLGEQPQFAENLVQRFRSGITDIVI